MPPSEWHKSVQLAKKAQHRAPNRGETRLLTAQLFAHHNYLSQAAVEFKAAIELSPWLWNEARVPVHTYLRKAPSLLFAAVGERAQHRSAMLGYLIGNQDYPVALSFWISGFSLGWNPMNTILAKHLSAFEQEILNASTTCPQGQESHILNESSSSMDGSLFLNSDEAKARRFLAKAANKELSIRLSTSDAIIARELAIELKELELARPLSRFNGRSQTPWRKEHRHYTRAGCLNNSSDTYVKQ